jgi:hypothetical protein
MSRRSTQSKQQYQSEFFSSVRGREPSFKFGEFWKAKVTLAQSAFRTLYSDQGHLPLPLIQCFLGEVE